MGKPTKSAVIGIFENGRNAAEDFLQLVDSRGGGIIGYIDAAGHLQGSLLVGADSFVYTGPLSGLPTTSTIGQLAFVTDATPGQNVYAATSTNTWTAVGGTGGGFVYTGILSGLPITATTGQIAFVTNVPAGQNIYVASAPNTWTQSGGTPTFTYTGILSGLPVTATVGQLAFVTNAPAGQNIYTATAPNTWTQSGFGTAPLASPTFTGTPSLPTGTTAITQAASDSSTAIATTAFVQSQGFPGIVSSGLMAQYKMLSTETVGALVDYSGNSNNATGTVGVAPSIIANTGGVQFNGNGAISLPAALNSALTIQIFSTFHTNDDASQPLESLIQGTDSTFVSGIGKICGITLSGGPNRAGDAWGPKEEGARQVRSLLAQNSQLYADSTFGNFEGTGSVTLVQGATDKIYFNGIEALYYVSTTSSAGLQTAGNYQLGGAAAGTGLQTLATYLTGRIFYALFYNRALTSAEVAQNHTAMASQMAQRGVTENIGGGFMQTAQTGVTGLLDLHPQAAFYGDSITQGYNSDWISQTTPKGSAGQRLQLNNLGRAGDVIYSIGLPANVFVNDTVYRPAGPTNVIFNWAGVNDGVNLLARAGYMRDFCELRHQIGWEVIPVTITSNTNEALSGASDQYNSWLRSQFNEFADGLCDIASIPNLGAVGADSNATYFTGSLHPTALANSSLVAPLFTRLMDRITGPQNWSSAYTASAGTISTPAFYQGFAFGGTTGTTISESFKSDNLARSTLFLASDGNAGGAITSVTDSNHNTWTLLQTQHNGNGIWIAQNVKSGPNTVTFVTPNAYLRGIIAEYSGVSLTAAPQVANAYASSANTSVNSGSITTTVNNSLIIGVAMNAALSAYTLTLGGSFAADVVAASGTYENFAHEVQGTAGAISFTATANTNINWDATVIALQPGSGNGGGDVTYVSQDQDLYLKVDPTGGNMVIQLVPATGLTAQKVHIKNLQTTGVNTVTLVPTTTSGITSVVANGVTAVFAVPNITGLIAGQTITVAGATTSGLNATYTITSTTLTSGTAGTFTVASSVTVTESETSAAQITSELIDGATSYVLANNTEITLVSVLNPGPSAGCNWISENKS